MSSPSQHQNSLRQPSSETHPSSSSSQPPPAPPPFQQPSSSSASPFSHHLPPPPLPSSNGPSSGQSLSLPPPHLLDRPYQGNGPMRSPLNLSSGNNTSSSHYALSDNSNTSSPSLGSGGGHAHPLPSPNSFVSTEHSSNLSSKPILPPLPTAVRAHSPYEDHSSTSSLPLPPPPPPPQQQQEQQQQHQQQHQQHQHQHQQQQQQQQQHKEHHHRRSVTRTPPPPPIQQQQEDSPTDPSTAGGYRPLNVRDALTYLDQVKVRFSDQPDVYNRFLDIMKDFKSQAIDTPGVIERVSTLFKGHPILISGFNTFLPPGYRIECSTDPYEPDLIRVTTPNGTTMTTGGRINMESENAMLPRPYYHQQQPYGMQPPSNLPPPSSSHHQPLSSSHHHSHYNGTPPPPQLSSSSIMSSTGLPTSSQYMSMGRPPTMPPLPTSPIQGGKRSPVEFNHAINYVNKIKNRFANEPDTYKQFLEILQTYQKEQKPIQEVYAHVQYLFNGAPDLLSEFKQFLPDITGQPASVLFADEQSSSSFFNDNAVDSSLGSFGNGKRGVGVVQKKKRGPVPLSAMGKRSKMYHKHEDVEALRADPYAFPASPFDPVHPTVSAEEVELFERIRKYIGNKPSYEEFLKTLNLYTQQIVDLDLLMEQVEVFIGSNRELFDWFKSVLGYESKEHPIRRPVRSLPKPDLMHCATVADSPSYRLAPVDWQNQPCSGRDQLAWEVLNDVYVSHPIWASEDDGFVASKKSQYEEAMHRCEEERYDYNMNIEANLNAIALLEPISKKLETMTLEEKAAYRLYPGLGGQSVTIYERIIKKVYDKDRGSEIIDLLYSTPAQVVPILLKRLKQKDDEWKKAQHDWNKIWRELDTKNYYRSLDYQGITFKGNDRKAMTVKAVVTEIESLHKNKKLKQSPKNIPSKKSYQFMYEFPDKDVFKDVTRVVYSYIDRQTGFNNHDREKVRTFIRSFIPLCFDVDNVEPEGVSNYSDENDDDDMMDDDDDAQSTNTEESESDVTRSPTSKRSTSPSPRRSRRGRNQEDDRTMDLLRDVLTKNKMALDEMGPVNVRATSPVDEEEAATKEEEEDVDIPATTESESNPPPSLPSPSPPLGSKQHVNGKEGNDGRTHNEKLLAAAALATAPESRKRTLYSFFCNTTFYAFFRLFEMIYGRLLKLKQLNEVYTKDPRYGKKTNQVALQLGLYSVKFDDINTSNGYYHAVLGLLDRFFEGDIEPQSFEESVRYFFVTDAYLLFTIDKLVHAFVKQIQAVTVDADSVELVRLFRSDQELDVTSRRILSLYRLRAEEIVGSEDNIYKINFEKKSNVMTLQLLDSDDYMLEPNKEDKYDDYISSYMDWVNPTEGVNMSSMKPSFLKRNLRLQDESLNEIYVRSQLQYKIDQDTYHMYYIDGSEDVFIRPGTSTNATALKDS